MSVSNHFGLRDERRKNLMRSNRYLLDGKMGGLIRTKYHWTSCTRFIDTQTLVPSKKLFDLQGIGNVTTIIRRSKERCERTTWNSRTTDTEAAVVPRGLPPPQFVPAWLDAVDASSEARSIHFHPSSKRGHPSSGIHYTPKLRWPMLWEDGPRNK